MFLQTLLSLSVLVLSPSLVESAALGLPRRENASGRSVRIRNDSGRRFDVMWINRQDNSFHSNSEDGEGYAYGAATAINSYVSHEFEIREMPSKKTGSCLYEECRTTYFQVNDQEGQDVLVGKDFKAVHTDDRSKAYEQANSMLEKCKEKIAAEKGELSPMESIDALTNCMEGKVEEKVAEREEERDFQSQLRQQMASKLVPYACGDLNYTTTVEAVNRTWNYKAEDGGRYRNYVVQLLHELPTSSIFQMPNFVTKQECEAMKFFLSPDGNHIPFMSIADKTNQGKLMLTVATRLYEMARTFLDWGDLDFHDMHNVGQELFDVHVDGNGLSVLPWCHLVDDPDEEGSCRLSSEDPIAVHTESTVIEDLTTLATAFLFCGEPEQGLGGVHFPYAGVHVNPEPYMLVMAIHRNIDESEMDGYVGEYHLCPNHEVLTHTFKKELPQEGEASEKAGDSAETEDSSHDEL